MSARKKRFLFKKTENVYLIILVFVCFIVMGKPLPCCDGLVGIVLGVEWSGVMMMP